MGDFCIVRLNSFFNFKFLDLKHSNKCIDFTHKFEKCSNFYKSAAEDY